MPIKKLSCRDKEKIYQLYQAGITAEALSADYGVTVSTIKNYIRYFRRKGRNEQWFNEQRERQAEQNRTPETSLISTAEYLYSLVQRLPDNVTVEVLRDSNRIAVSITGAGEDIILANSKGGFCEAGKAD